MNQTQTNIMLKNQEVQFRPYMILQNVQVFLSQILAYVYRYTVMVTCLCRFGITGFSWRVWSLLVHKTGLFTCLYVTHVYRL